MITIKLCFLVFHYLYTYRQPPIQSTWSRDIMLKNRNKLMYSGHLTTLLTRMYCGHLTTLLTRMYCGHLTTLPTRMYSGHLITLLTRMYCGHLTTLITRMYSGHLTTLPSRMYSGHLTTLPTRMYSQCYQLVKNFIKCYKIVTLWKGSEFSLISQVVVWCGQLHVKTPLCL